MNPAKSDSPAHGSAGTGASRLPATEIRGHLQRVLASSAFCGSKRSHDFLAFVVEHALTGRLEMLKERIIGVELFGRETSYDPSGDSIVRVKANEVRKRLAQYYQEAGAREAWRIQLPPGSYVPEFERRAAAAAAPKPGVRLRRVALWGLPGATALIAVLLMWGWNPIRSDMDRFWAPVLSLPRPVIVCMGASEGGRVSSSLRLSLERIAAGEGGLAAELKVRPEDISPLEGDWVARGNFFALLDLAHMLQEYGKPAQFRPSIDLALDELRDSPIIFIGAFNNRWTGEIHKDLRFGFEQVGDGEESLRMVRDQADPRPKWAVNAAHPSKSPVDYALITRISQPGKWKMVVLAAGIRWHGTQAAGEFITNRDRWREVARSAPSGWHKKNMQIVLETRVVGKTPQPPNILATHFW